MGFPKSWRLLKRGDFDRVYRQGRRYSLPDMAVFYLAGNEPGAMRVGFTVPRALGGAVKRNRIKRRLREAVRMALPSVRIAADVVINPRAAAAEMPFEQLRVEVEEAFRAIAQGKGTSRSSAVGRRPSPTKLNGRRPKTEVRRQRP